MMSQDVAQDNVQDDPKIAANVTAIRRQGGTDDDVAEYLQSVGASSVNPRLTNTALGDEGARQRERSRIAGLVARITSPAQRARDYADSPAVAAVRQFGQGVSLGGADELDAAVTSLVSGRSYKDELADVQRAVAGNRAEYPIGATVAELAGGAAIPGLGAAKGLQAATRLGKIGYTMGTAGATGALAGALGASPGARGLGAAVGGGLGATLGGAASGLAGRLGNVVADNSDEVLRRAVQAAGGIAAVQEAVKNAATTGGREATVMLADVARPLMRAARGARSLSPAADQTLTDRLGGRAAQVGARMRDDLAAATGRAPEEAFTAGNEFVESARTAAAPLYAQAEQEAAQVAARVADVAPMRRLPKDLSALSDEALAAAYADRAGKANRALGRIQGEMKRRGMAQRDAAPLAETARLSARDEMQQVTKALRDPDVAEYVAAAKRESSELRNLPDTDHRVLDAAYNMMNDVYGTLKRRLAVPGAADETTRLRMGSLNTARAALRDAVESVAPTYTTARAAYSGPMRLQDAFEQGAARNVKPDEVAHRLQGLRGAEREAFQRGDLSRWAEDVTRIAPNPDFKDLAQAASVVKQVFGTEEARNRFIAAQGQDAYDALVKRLTWELRGSAANQGIRGGSNTVDKGIDALETSGFDLDKALQALTEGGRAGLLRRAVDGPVAALSSGTLGRTAQGIADKTTAMGQANIEQILQALAARPSLDLATKRGRAAAIAQILSRGGAVSAINAGTSQLTP